MDQVSLVRLCTLDHPDVPFRLVVQDLLLVLVVQLIPTDLAFQGILLDLVIPLVPLILLSLVVPVDRQLLVVLLVHDNLSYLFLRVVPCLP